MALPSMRPLRSPGMFENADEIGIVLSNIRRNSVGNLHIVLRPSNESLDMGSGNTLASLSCVSGLHNLLSVC